MEAREAELGAQVAELQNEVQTLQYKLKEKETLDQYRVLI